jgi:enoyl-CoA hydratase/3-hydroxyacyl-CoA dehydrogenase
MLCFVILCRGFILSFGISGKTNGKGYYIYEKGSKPRPDPSVLPIIEESRRLANIMPNGKVLLLR